MINKLKVNKNKLQKKGLILGIGLMLGTSLIGCGTNILTTESYNSETIESTTNEDVNFYPVTIEFNNFDDNTFKNEIITFYDNNATIYNGIKIDIDGAVNTTINVQNCNIISHVLNKSITLPTTDDEHKIMINIDYNTGSMNASLENLKTLSK